jgi:hypothetical protein
MAGMAKKLTMKATEPVNITFNIQQGFWVGQLVSLAKSFLTKVSGVQM